MFGEGKPLNWMENVYSFEIPYFQRPYVWNEKEGQFEDLINSIETAPAGRMPFFGSLILKKISSEEDPNKVFSVVDGQQRLTTFSILIRAIIDVLLDNETAMQSSSVTTLKNMIYRIHSQGYNDIGNSGVRGTSSRPSRHTVTEF